MTEGIFDPEEDESLIDDELAPSMNEDQQIVNLQGTISQPLNPSQTPPVVADEDESAAQRTGEMGQKPSKNTVKVSSAEMEKKQPLQLLDLPVDILRSVLKEVGSWDLIPSSYTLMNYLDNPYK